MESVFASPIPVGEALERAKSRDDRLERIESDSRTHRTDIDGLRAMAVLPVVAFHAGSHAARGGFIGVDVFFVISGFLITQLIAAQIETGSFSIGSFYERRVRRILPALLCVLLAVYLLGLAYSPPTDMVGLSQSIVAAAFSASNLYFWLGAGYFDGAAISKPLLHTWSLAVEEQFYLFWPVFLVFGHRYFRRHLIWVVGGLSLASLLASAVGAFEFANATFYLPFTRFWELSVGGLLALGAVPWRLGQLTRNLLAAFGLIFIVASVFLIDQQMPFPGVLALPPCLGAFLVILAGRDGDTLVGRCLAWRPIAFVGAISYSLYLWSWPITVFQRNYAFLWSGLSDPGSKLLIGSVSLAAAFLSWKFIETPFRVGPRRPSTARLLKVAVTGTGALLALGILGWVNNGFPNRFSVRELQAASYMDYDGRRAFRFGQCFFAQPLKEWKLGSECLVLSPAKKNYLLLGDSHAADLWFGLNATFGDVNFLQATAADCFPTITHSFNESAKCTLIMDGIFKDFLLHRQIDHVLLSAKWRPASLPNLSATLRWMVQHHIRVTLIGPVPVYDSPIPRLLVSALQASDPDLPQHHKDQSILGLDAEMRRLAKSQNVDYVSMTDLFCAARGCVIADANGAPFMFDGEHFTTDGSLFAARRLISVMQTWTAADAVAGRDYVRVAGADSVNEYIENNSGMSAN